MEANKTVNLSVFGEMQKFTVMQVELLLQDEEVSEDDPTADTLAAADSTEVVKAQQVVTNETEIIIIDNEACIEDDSDKAEAALDEDSLVDV